MLVHASEQEFLLRACPQPIAILCNLNSNCITTNTIVVTGPATFEAPVTITDTTPSHACSEGALVVDGGVGIGGDLNVCGHVTAGGARNVPFRAIPG